MGASKFHYLIFKDGAVVRALVTISSVPFYGELPRQLDILRPKCLLITCTVMRTGVVCQFPWALMHNPPFCVRGFLDLLLKQFSTALIFVVIGECFS